MLSPANSSKSDLTAHHDNPVVLKAYILRILVILFQFRKCCFNCINILLFSLSHHYFSRENLCRDQTFLNMLVDRLILPIEKLVKAPRLAALNTTHEEVEKALLGSKIVCVEDMNAGMRGVRRIDGCKLCYLR